jgi:hypothetical protein
MRIRVVMRDKSGTQFLKKEMRDIEILKESDLERIAKTCESIIKETIMNKSANPTGKLASGFYAHPFGEGWAVGDIPELDSTIPYWNHQDKGSLGIGANWNHFKPNGPWQAIYNENYGGWIVPRNPIPAMNYIAETLQKMETIIPQLLKRNI